MGVKGVSPLSPDRSSSYILGSVLLLLGTLILFSCLVAFIGVPSNDFLLLLLSAPGTFFLGAFQLAALYIPAYLMLSAGLVMRKTFSRNGFIILNLGALPFFTLALLFQLLTRSANASGQLIAAISRSLTPAGGVVLCIILLVAETMLIAGVTGGRIAAKPQREAERRKRYEPEFDFDSREHEARGPEAIRAIALITAEPPTEPRDEVAEVEELEGAEDFLPEIEDTSVADFPGTIAPDLSYAVHSDIFDAEPAVQSAGPSEREAQFEEDTYFFHEGTFSDSATDDAVLLETIDPESADLPESLPVEQTSGKAPNKEPGAPPPLSSRRKRPGEYKVPIKGILNEYEDRQYWVIDDVTRKAAEILKFTLEEFQIQAEVTGIRKGPVITMFEILPAPGVKLAKIVNLADNIALRLAAQSVRIVAPIPGRHAVGIEIPNKHRAIVSFAELIEQESFWDPKIDLPIALGKDIPGDAQIVDLSKTPHLLIAGATGSGKSVCVNSIICSLLYRKRPDEVKMILIDPKIVELKFYNDIPHLLTPVITDPKRAFQALQYAIYEMERRYSLLDALGVRDIRSYNNRIRQRNMATEPIPYIVIVVDEFADLMATTGKELESTLARLAAMSRAVGIHLVLATQRPSTDVITGLIKANIPSRIAFMVASKVDSRIIIDAGGAEKLLGRGDMLFTSAWDPFPFRMQGAFLSEDEVERVVTYVKTLGEPDYIDDEIFIEEDDETFIQQDLEDPLMEKAMEIVVSAGKASASYLQRRLKIGYNRAARLVEEMERIGVVGPQNGSKARDVIHIPDRAG